MLISESMSRIFYVKSKQFPFLVFLFKVFKVSVFLLNF